MRQLRDASLKDLNTWGCGGSCLALVIPEGPEEAAEAVGRALTVCDKMYVLGGGSNVLVQEGKLKAAVLLTAALDGLSWKDEKDSVRVRVGSGYPVRELLGTAFIHGWGGLEFLTGIPGTVGGALEGNAGAGGRSFGPFVENIRCVMPDGSEKIVGRGGLKWEYRASPWKEPPLLIADAELLLPKREQRNIIENIRHFSQLKKGQPIGAKTAGCVFKNPEGKAAGALLDECGCKRFAAGDAKVSQHHANFIENTGSASSDEIFALAELCRKSVYEKFGIRLEYEIKFIGAFQTQ